jgi:hypothetical protein
MRTGCVVRARLLSEVRAKALAAIAILALCGPVRAFAQSEQTFPSGEVQGTEQLAQQEAPHSPADSFPEIIPHFGQGVADSAEVARVAGHTQITFESCPTTFRFGDHRRVQLQLGKSLRQSLFDTPTVADALLAKAALATWKSCPQEFNDARPDFHFNIESVKILDADGSVALSAALGSGFNGNSDQLFGRGHDGYAWADVTDGYKAHQQQLAQDSANAAYEANLAGQQVQRRAQADANSAAFAAGFWRIVKFIVGVTIAIWLFNRREAIAEWYYALTPHPSTAQVDNAVHRNLPIDGDLFAAVNQPFDGNKYEINVRNRQADALTERLRRHEAALRTQSETILRKKREEVLRETEFMRAHEALINAGVDHEVAAAHLDALRKATRQ